MEQIGSRYSHQLSIAPTGTLALTFGNNCSSGIEPTFADEQIRNIIVSGRKTKGNARTKKRNDTTLLKTHGRNEES